MLFVCALLLGKVSALPLKLLPQLGAEVSLLPAALFHEVLQSVASVIS